MKTDTIFEALRHLNSCPKATKILFGSIFTAQKINRGQRIIHNEVNLNHEKSPAHHHIHFLQSGLLHLHHSQTHYDPDHTRHYRKNTTIRFYFPQQFFCLTTDTKPHPENPVPNAQPQLTALRDSILYTTNYQKVLDTYHNDPHIAHLVLALQDQWNTELLEELNTHHRPAIERYQHFIQQTKQYQLHIPQQHIASYLLISTKHLSRLKYKDLLHKPKQHESK